MKRIIITPAGRIRFLEILYLHLLTKKNEFDEWHLWVNTDNEDDVEYIYQLEKENNWIKTVPSKLPIVKGYPVKTIVPFYEYCIDQDSMYLKLDDDICFIEKGSIDKIFKERQSNDKSLLVFGNIINNSIISHYYQKNNIISSEKLVTYDAFDEVGLKDAIFAEDLHRLFLNKYESIGLEHFYMKNIKPEGFPRISINAVAWTGKMFNEFEGKIDHYDDEDWLSHHKSKMINSPNIIVGDTIFCHFSFGIQRNHLESTDILPKYKLIALEEFLNLKA
jgi:hypothetical protein